MQNVVKRPITYKLVFRLINVLGDTNKDVEKQDLPCLMYLEAVLKETLRLYPVTPVITRRNTEDIKISK